MGFVVGAAAGRRPAPQTWMVLGAGVLVIVLPFVLRDTFLLNAFFLVFLFGAMAQAWNLIGGYAGQISFGHAVFFGLGAYAGAVLLSRYGLSPWLSLWVGAAVSVLVSLLIGFPTLRLRRHFFALATLALGEIMRILFLNWPYVGAAIGLYLPLEYRNRFAYLMWDSKVPYYFTALALLVLATGVTAVVDRHRAGIYLRALNQDEDAAGMLGIPIRRYKLYAMALSAALTSLCGTVYALYVLYIDPYNVMAGRISLLIVVIALIGGRATVAGPVLGAVFIILLSEYTRSWLGGAGGGVDFILFGALIMAVSIREPQGLMGLLRRRSLGPDTVAEDIARSEQPIRPAAVVTRQSHADQLPSAPGAAREVVLRVVGLSKRFGGVQAVRGVTLEVYRGEICGLIGPNGAGKSTLFDCITGFQRPDRGALYLNGRALSSPTPHTTAWAGAGRTFQGLRVFADLTVWENLMCGQEHRGEGLWRATLHGHPPAAEARGRTLLESFGLGPLRDQPAGALSYGQQKLLSIAMAVLREPALVLLDEPVAGVNPVLAEEITEHIRRLNAQGVTFLVIEHNMEVIMALAHRILFMAGGEIIAHGPPGEIQRHEKVLELYYGR
ncbi:MAG: branched-chain amino acid ABC transporter ATP-binding protein/permease [Armatimonadota bacterium]|nr:branched-chain amino acid ABC transporter ATP-binding protein/permease [Armatimonadota bacterium]MDR7451642.1 branched-chain amino acid ABC transporter ATP-binding protein/permease [Armatimonadota bacterium]MDR7467638.1 branched-chain amino acid ABC transporter ATP-binding protein/permease [Armatimonadota bacterium]MDR7492611.1 branched-chain amino acid ABC transporter ATP-binding protein/permease [Armatimonadota bacterium]MDR7499921.1 branched-chain amino acid ABC transporter ATP-binding pr